jgi:hypothetical protein
MWSKKRLMHSSVPEVDPPAAHDTADPDATTESSPAMPVLRRPHDHCRGLCAR